MDINPEPPLLVYMKATSGPERDAAFIQMYAQRLRDGNALLWEIPSTVAGTMDAIANRICETEKKRIENVKHYREQKPCIICRWPRPYDNEHNICECCGFQEGYDYPENYVWDGRWWAKDLERQPKIVEKTMALLKRYLDNHCQLSDQEGMTTLCECKLCKETRALVL